MSSLLLRLLLCLFPFCHAATVSYNWNVGWIQANPDGRAERMIIGVNGQWPCPAISANIGDVVSVTINNQLGNESTSIHFHGLHQAGTNQMDGPAGVTQCPIPPGQSFTYTFSIQQPGTYWWHSHSPGQFADGLRGPLIVHDPHGPYAGQYDAELLVTLSDWYHDQMPGLLTSYLTDLTSPLSSFEPVPYTALMGDGRNPQFPIVPGKRYMVRFINIGAFSQFFLRIDQHNMTIIEVDGIYTQPKDTQDLYIAVAQRYAAIIHTLPSSNKNFAIYAEMDRSGYNYQPDYLISDVVGSLVYNSAAPAPAKPNITSWTIFDDLSLVPLDLQPRLEPVMATVDLSLSFFTQYNQNRAGFNGITYIPPKVPTMMTAMSAPRQYVSNPAIYGNHTNPFVLNYGDIVEIVITNTDNGYHPVHLHGHSPQVVQRTPSFAQLKNGTTSLGKHISVLGSEMINWAIPMRRDTYLVPAGGTMRFRFVANNPGVWLLHCHMEWHVSAGLTATFLEAPDRINNAQGPLTRSMQSICASQGIPTVGNAAGNTKNWLDLGNQTGVTGVDTSVWPS